MGQKYLYVADMAGTGPDLLGKMFAAQSIVSNAQWVFGGNYIDAKSSNVLTITMINNWISQWHAVALWGPHEVALQDFIQGRSTKWLKYGGQNVVSELLGGRTIDDLGAIRDLMRHQEMISWLLSHLQVIYDAKNAIFARSGVYLNRDYLNTPLDFATTAEERYWWNPGSQSFAYNQTGKLVVTSSYFTSRIHGTYINAPHEVIRGPRDDRSFGIQYPGEPARLILQRTTKYDENSRKQLPVVYIIDSDDGLVGAL